MMSSLLISDSMSFSDAIINNDDNVLSEGLVESCGTLKDININIHCIEPWGFGNLKVIKEVILWLWGEIIALLRIH